MKANSLLENLFPGGHSIEVDDGVLLGFSVSDGKEIAVLGTANHRAIDVSVALRLAEFVLTVIKDKPGCPILMLVDTEGQHLSKTGEILGINGYLAHLVKCLGLASKEGHFLVSLVYGEAVSGGFLSFGLMADEIHALAEAKIRVMNLPAMARITKLPLEMLEDLSWSSPSFAPGVENFFKLGGVKSIWSPPFEKHLKRIFGQDIEGDQRRKQGLERQGRKLAYIVSQKVLDG